MHSGYYIFLGKGDHHAPLQLDANWACTWDLAAWKAFVLKLVDDEVDTLLMYMNGHALPYESRCFPFLVDRRHPNVQQPFLLDLFAFIKAQGIKIVAVLSTTGHLGQGARFFHEVCIENTALEGPSEHDLVAFPAHLREGKTKQKAGAAQLGYGVLCHHKTATGEFVVALLSEIAELYGAFFDGVALHPPETLNFCACSHCKALFFTQHGYALTEATPLQKRTFFTTSYLSFQSRTLVPLLEALLPEAQLYMFTIPWLFEEVFDAVGPLIPKTMALIEWDYNLSEDRIAGLSHRLQMYQSQGHSVWFMPAAGTFFNVSEAIEQQVAATHAQVARASREGVQGIAYFLGPKVSPHLELTRLKACDTSSAQCIPTLG